ncbi:MAG TPA: ATPase, T2SS/T4P/T4SS family [Ktedonobacteraceae bacterium]|nr:ATPase, T2SS/T4P/T4SS family [Ktedonobacteraceae bacterium]
MQLDQPGELSLANGPVAHIPRSRPGVRASMRVTNRYTMPPLMPRSSQNPPFSWDAQGQALAASSSPCMEPLLPVEEDAWLNDVPPPYRNNSSASASAENRATARAAPTIHAPRVSPDTGNALLPGQRLWSVGRRLSERVCQELARRQAIVEGNDAEIVEQARECAVDILRAEPALASQVYNLTEAERVIQAVLDEVAGFGPLAALWREDAVTEIMAVGPRLTIVERDGDMQEAPYHFEDEQHMLRIAGNILRGAERAFDPSIVITNARLPDGTFVNIVMPPAAVKGLTLTLRRRRKDVLTLAELVKLETLSEPMAHFLHMCVEARLNIVICGGLRSGRTTLLNALAACIPATERIVTLEDMAELQLQQKQVVSLEARLMTSENSERGNSSSMRELLMCALRLRPERIILGDCWNDDAGMLLSALHTGYNGSLFATYANGLQDCLGRLEMMWLASRSATPVSITREQVARAVHLVIHIGRLSNGARKVMNIAQVQGVQGNKIKARSIFHFQENSDGQGRFEPGNFVPACLAELRQSIPPVRA